MEAKRDRNLVKILAIKKPRFELVLDFCSRLLDYVFLAYIS